VTEPTTEDSESIQDKLASDAGRGLSRRSAVVGGLAIAATAAAVFVSRPNVAFAYSGGNGDIDPASLTEIHYPGVSPMSPSMNPMRLEPNCAVAFMALLTAFHEQTGDYLPVDEGYRDLATQALYGPTGTSNHGWGKAVDFYRAQTSVGTSNYAWLTAHAAEFGFTVLQQPFEPWHWNYSGTYTPPVTVPTAPPRRREEEESMYSIVSTVEGTVYIVGMKGKKEAIQTPAHVVLLLRNKYGKLDANNQPKDKFEMDTMYTSEVDIINFYLSKVNA
jgi:hypothetical protein